MSELDDLFAQSAPNGLEPDVRGELQSILRLHSIPVQELSYKWESYTIKMGSDQTKLDLKTVRAFKKDLQEALERESRGKSHVRSVDRRGAHATPRSVAKGGDVFDLLDSMVPVTPLGSRPAGGSIKRKSNFETPAVPKFNRSHGMSSPTDGRQTDSAKAAQANSFRDRQNAGQIVETLNDHLSACESPIAPYAEQRVTLRANTDLKKFFYKPMAMHLSEASEILDDRIDEFQNLIQDHLGLEASAFGSAASRSTTEIIAVGRIVSDSLEGKLNAASMMLEVSRRTGAGLRVPLNTDAVSYEFFPGQIVAVRGINASGEYFSASEVIDIPYLPPPASSVTTIDTTNERLGLSEESPNSSSASLNIMVASGPYTADDNVEFEPLKALCEKAESTYADALILIGPILDLEHPLLATGDFDLPDDADIEPDKATMNDVFRVMVSAPLRRLAENVPNITIVLVPSVRDLVNKHVSWPQEPFEKKTLSLPKQVKVVTNPVMISLNETLIGITAHDVMNDLRREEVVVGKPSGQNLMARLPKHVIQQRHFYPIFPPTDRTILPKPGFEDAVATGMPLDTSYMKLGEWLNARPDILVMPSVLSPFAKVVESVTVINPGQLSKRKSPGTYAQLTIHPRKITSEERDAETTEGGMLGHNLFDRARVDVVRI